MPSADSSVDVRRPTFRELLRIRAFAILFWAEAQSLVGEQLARVALSVLVFYQTGSAAATAATYAATFLPAILGGAVLARIGDRLPRLEVMVGCDGLRAVAFAAMAVPGVPLWVVEVLLVIGVFVEPAFSAAQSSYLADRLDDEQFRAATGLRMATNQIGQIGGYAVGGALVAVIHPRGALALDAATFALSALVITVGLLVRDRRAGAHRSVAGDQVAKMPRVDAGTSRRTWRIRDDPRVTTLIALTSLAGLFVVPEGLVIPYTRGLGESTQVAGLLLAAIPAGGALGVFLLRLVPPRRRASTTNALVIACGIPLIGSVWQPPWPVVAALWLLSGAAAAYQVDVFARIARIVPDASRARTIGVVAAFLTGSQGVGLALFGLVAQWSSSGAAIAWAGVAGALCACGVVARGRSESGGVARDSVAA